MDKTRLTPPQVAKKLGVSCRRVRAWIVGGELEALNLGPVKGKRARFAVDEAAIEAFLAKRRTTPDTQILP